MSERITAETIRAAISKTYRDPEWAVLFEVASGTGAHKGRSADAILMSLWPSRGLHLHGVEIKVSRSDWQREAKDPTKAEAIAQYCDYWWVYVAPGVIKDVAIEVPDKWGVREFDGKTLKQIKEAKLLDPVPMDRSFLAALMRRSDEAIKRAVNVEAIKIRDGNDEAIAERVKQEVERRTRHNTEALQIIEAFEAQTGLKITEYGTAEEVKEVAQLINLVRTVGIDRPWSGIRSTIKTVAARAREMEEVLAKYDQAFDPSIPNTLTDVSQGFPQNQEGGHA